MLCADSRADIDADRIFAITDAALRESAVTHVRDELLSSAVHDQGLTLVVTDWLGRMPQVVRGILAELIAGQSKPGCRRLTGIDLHGKVSWFVQLMQSHRDVFESRESHMQSVELSLVDEGSGSSVATLPRFGNLRALRVYQPEFGTSEVLTDLLRHNLAHLREFACVSHSSAAAFLEALRELDVAPPSTVGGAATLATLAAEQLIEAGVTASSLDDRGYPPFAVDAIACARADAAARRTSLWLRGREAPMTEALVPLGAAIARGHALPERERSFLGRLADVRLDLSELPTAGLDSFRSHAGHRLRDELLGPDAKLGLRLRVEARRPTVEHQEIFMCLLMTSLPVGIESARGLYLPILAHGTTVPTRKAFQLWWNDEAAAFVPATAAIAVAVAEATEAPVTTRTLRVYMGARALAADNHFLGEVEVQAGVAPVTLVVDIDANDVLRMHGTRLDAYGDHNIVTVQNLLDAAAQFAEQDRAQRAALLAEEGLTEETFVCERVAHVAH